VNAHRRRIALAYIEREFRSPELSPRAVAGAVRLSVRQLHRAFEASATTAAAEIRRVRIERATQMIRANPGTPVTDVAMACGFNSLASFYRLFKSTTGMTASQWRSERVTSSN
jgi:AraC-like DNA-binding protein